MRLQLALIAALMVAVGAPARGQPLMVRLAGTWNLDIAKSNLHAPAPQSETSTITPSTTDTIATLYTITGTDGKGKPINLSFDGKFDGQHHPVMSNGQEVAKIAWHRSGPRQFSGHEILTNGTTVSATLTLAPDGKSFTVRGHVDAKDGAYDLVELWNKH
jgi:hypothetical protein